MPRPSRRVEQAERRVVRAAMRTHNPWTRKYAEMLLRYPHVTPLDLACARLYLARLAARGRRK